MIDEKKLLDDFRTKLDFNEPSDAVYRIVRDIINTQPKVGEWIPLPSKYEE